MKRKKFLKWFAWIAVILITYVLASGPEYRLWRKGFLPDGVFRVANYPLVWLSGTDSLLGSMLNGYWSYFFVRSDSLDSGKGTTTLHSNNSPTNNSVAP
jgi:hypothetical protein